MPQVIQNAGSAKFPLDLDDGMFGYCRNGEWRLQSPETKRLFGDEFVKVTNPELIIELISRAYCALYPHHDCIDHPNLPCPACNQEGLRAFGIIPRRSRAKARGCMKKSPYQEKLF